MMSLDPPGQGLSPRHLSLPGDSYNDIADMMRHAAENTLGLGDTGRMISSALSDGYLPGIGLDDHTPKVCVSYCLVTLYMSVFIV